MISDLRARLPQSDGAVLLDEIVSESAESVTCKARLCPEHPYNCEAGIPALICVELLAQCAALSRSTPTRGTSSRGPTAGVLAAVPELELRTEYLPAGSLLIVTATLRATLGASLAFDGHVEDQQGNVVATGSLLVRETTQEIAQ